MLPGLLGNTGSDDKAPREPADLFDPVSDAFADAFRLAATADPVLSALEPTILARLELRIGKPAKDWTADDSRIAVRTLGFLVDRAYRQTVVGGIVLKSDVSAAGLEPGRGRPRASIKLGALPLGLLSVAVERKGRGRPAKYTDDDYRDLVDLIDAEKRRPDESDRQAIMRIVEHELAAAGLRLSRKVAWVKALVPVVSRARAAVAKFDRNSG